MRNVKLPRIIKITFVLSNVKMDIKNIKQIIVQKYVRMVFK